jgi:tRNA-dihydrouridine synthase B
MEAGEDDLNKISPVARGSLFFAPMEGITNEAFRKTILTLYPEWDYLATDFLRVPSAGKYPHKYLVKHFGKELFETPDVLEKTMFQILTSHNAFTLEMVKQIEELTIPWLDMNIGCPSNTVCRSRGGSFLLTDLARLAGLVKLIRTNYTGRFTCKIRIGYNDTNNFEECIRMLNGEGVEMITVHARTRLDMYKEPARWKFIEKAVELSEVPIVGNGDIWKTSDIDKMLKETGCHSVMIARGALKAPWMAKDYKSGKFDLTQNEIIQRMKVFLNEYRLRLEVGKITERGLLKQGKSITRFMLDDLDLGEQMRRRLVLSKSVHEFFSIVDEF